MNANTLIDNPPKTEELRDELRRHRHIQDQITGISNDLNNLIAVMKGQAQIACENNADSEKDELVRVVLSATLKAEAIIERLHIQAPAPPAPPKVEKPPPRVANILVADDEHTMRDLLGRMLRSSGYTVQLASSGSEALEISRGQTFDIAFIDFQLGDMKGTDVFKILNANSPNTHVIFVSGDPNAEEDTRAQRARAPSTFIKKPFDISEIKKKVSYILTMRSALT